MSLTKSDILFLHCRMSEKNGKQYVVVHNQLARHQVAKRLASLGVQNQRVIAYLIATGIKNHASDEMPEQVEGSIVDLAQACGITTGGELYSATKAAIMALIGNVIEWRDPEDGHEVYTSWLAAGHYYVGEGRFRCRFSPELRSVLTDLHKHRTEMDLSVLLALGGGNYAHRLYTLAKSWESAKGWIASIEELRGQLGVPEGAYSRIADFQIKCLDYPLKSINSTSDIRLEYKPIKRGRKITHIAFTIKPQKTGETRANARTIDPKNPQQIDDLPVAEQKQAWSWIRTQPAGEDLPEKMNWSKIKISPSDALKYWLREKNQAKFSFAE